MIGHLPALFADSLSNEQMNFVLNGMLIGLPTIIAVVAIWAGAWTKVHKLQLENALKQQMIDRGMTAEDIVAVVKSRRPSEDAEESPSASEVVVDVDGEWQTGLVLRRDGERYYVHLVGTEMSDNQWVTTDRVRFPAAAEDRCGSPLDWSAAAGAFRNGGWCGRSGHSKPAPVDQEI
jgi:hypothetical protein